MKFLKFIIILVSLVVGSFSTLFISARNYQDCPYTNIDCAQCCKAGRFASTECLQQCNCWQYNDQAGAEYKDFPV